MTRTKQEFVFVNDVCNSEVKSAKRHDLRLDNAVCDRDGKYEDRLRVYRAVVDHRWSIEFGKI
jgi:hypothetical protein